MSLQVFLRRFLLGDWREAGELRFVKCVKLTFTVNTLNTVSSSQLKIASNRNGIMPLSLRFKI